MKRILLELECISQSSLLAYNYQIAIRAYIYNKIGVGDEQLAENLLQKLRFPSTPLSIFLLQ